MSQLHEPSPHYQDYNSSYEHHNLKFYVTELFFGTQKHMLRACISGITFMNSNT